MLYKVVTLFLALFILTLDFVMMIPLTPLISEHIGMPIEQAGLLIAIYPVLAVISGLIAAPFSDRFGRKPILMILLAGLLVASLVSCVVTTTAGIFAARAMAGMFAGVIMPTAIAYAGDAANNPAERSKMVTWVLLAIPLASTLGVPFMAWLAEISYWQSAFGAIAVLTSVNLLLAFRLPHIPTGVAMLDWAKLYEELFALWTTPATRTLLTIEFLLVFAVYGFVPQLGPWLSLNFGMSTTMIGICFLIGGLGGISGNLIASHFVRGGARILPITVGAILLAVCLVFATSSWLPILLPVSAFPVAIISGVLFFTLAGDASRYPAVQVMLTELVPIDLRGRLLLMNIIVTNLAIAIAGFGGSTMISIQNGVLNGMEYIAYAVIGITLLLLILLKQMSSHYHQSDVKLALSH